MKNKKIIFVCTFGESTETLSFEKKNGSTLRVDETAGVQFAGVFFALQNGDNEGGSRICLACSSWQKGRNVHVFYYYTELLYGFSFFFLHRKRNVRVIFSPSLVGARCSCFVPSYVSSQNLGFCFFFVCRGAIRPVFSFPKGSKIYFLPLLCR